MRIFNLKVSLFRVQDNNVSYKQLVDLVYKYVIMYLLLYKNNNNTNLYTFISH